MPVPSAATPGMERVLSLFGLTFPPVVFLAMTYAGLGDAVFLVNRVVGRRLNQRLRMLVRRGYVSANALAALAAAAALGVNCGGGFGLGDACGAAARRPLLERRECLLSAGVVTLALGVVYGVDRVAVPLLAVNDRTPSYARGLRARIFHGATLCVVWLCLAEGETLAVALLLAAAGRRALALLPRTGAAWVWGLRLYTLLYTARVLRGGCHDRDGARANAPASARLPVAATLAVFAI